MTFSISQNQAARWTDERGGLVRCTRDQAHEVDFCAARRHAVFAPRAHQLCRPSFSPDTGSFQVRGVLPNPKLELRPGMFVTAYLRGAVRPNAIVVPQLAVAAGANGQSGTWSYADNAGRRCGR